MFSENWKVKTITRSQKITSLTIKVKGRTFEAFTSDLLLCKRKLKNLYLEHSIYFLAHALVVQIWISKFSHQFVYSCHDVRHFFSRDAAVAVDVVKGKRPSQFLVDGTTRQYAEASDKVLEQSNKIGSLKISST